MDKKRKINVLIVDDDEMARKQSAQKIGLFVEPEFIYMASNSVEIMSIVKRVPIALAFLDLEMPDTDGFFVAGYLKENQPKAKYVFLTGHAEFGAKSYDYEPLDFLCKPLDVMRLQKTFDRFDKTRQEEKRSKKKIAVETSSGFVMISPDEIWYITREHRKSVIYCKGNENNRNSSKNDSGNGDNRNANVQSYTAKGSLDELELIFSDYGIFRCHQSYLVPLKKIERVMQTEFGRSYWAILSEGEKIPVSRGRYSELRQAMAESGVQFI